MSKLLVLSLVLVLATACEPGGMAGMDAMGSDASHDGADSGPSNDAVDAGPPPTVSVQMDFTRQGGFFTAPFPSEDRRMPGNTIDIHDFPNPGHRALVTQIISMLESDAHGFATTAGSRV